MYKVTKRDCPMFGIGPYVCEFICDTASDISTLPTSISEGTGGRTAYDNQKCASGSMANVADNGAESKQYMLNNQDIWCPYSVASGSSEHQDLSEYAKKADVPSIKVNSAVNADTVNGHTVNADIPADAVFTDTVPDLSPYALKSKYGDTTIDVGRKANTKIGSYSTAEGQNTTASGIASHAEGFNTTASGYYSHAEGQDTTASGTASHAEGYTTIASMDYSHTEGIGTSASGTASHAEGFNTIASGKYSHAGGKETKALHDNEVAYGSYNESNDDTLFSIGDGTANSKRHNAFEITTSGGKLHDKDIATADLIPTELPANGGNADTVKSIREDIRYIDIFSTSLSCDHACWNKNCCVTGQSVDPDGDAYIINAPESSDALWYEVMTIGNIAGSSRAYQIAHGCYGHQRKSFIRYKHDDVWSDWKNIADGGNANTVGGKDPGKIFYDNGMSSDLNSATKSGCYGASPDTINTPLSTWLLVETMNYNDQFMVQKAYTIGDATHTLTYVRNYANNTWSVWSEISTITTPTT